MITIAKEDSVAHRRLVFSRLRDKDAVTKLFTDLGPRMKDRPGGYLRILKCGFRAGDKAPMAYIELVDRAEMSQQNSDSADLQSTLTYYAGTGFNIKGRVNPGLLCY